VAHWENRPEARWKQFRYSQPYSEGLRCLKEEVLGKTDFDPATLWQWGTMQAMALLEVLKDCETAFGAAGQQVVFNALRRIGLDVGRQILAGVEMPEEITVAEFASFYATVCNRIAYASLEAPRIDGEEEASFDILWCPHQNQYGAFDCRVQRYFVQGMLDAAREHLPRFDFQVRFDCTMPAGAPTCHFTLWKPSPEEEKSWEAHTKRLEEKALARARGREADSRG
jgi:hypothetical protein